MKKKKIGAVEIYIGMNLILFTFMFLKDPKLTAPTLIKFGAPTGFALADGQFWRLVMGMFLHASWEHLAFNCFSLYIFGRLVEHFYGPKKFILISVGTGVLATLGSFLFGYSTTVGASGVIYGYFAFHLYLFLLNKEGYKKYFGTDIFVLLGINIVYSFLRPNIDIAGHLFGLLGGLSLYLLLDKKRVQKSVKGVLLLIILLLSFFSTKHVLSFKGTQDYYLSKIYYLDKENEPVQRDKLIEEYVQKYPKN